MKTILFALSFFAGSFFMNARASETPVDPSVAVAFQSRFAHATNVAWSEAGSLHKVRFVLDGQTANAYYNAEGTLVALTRQMSVSELPATLRSLLRNSLGNRWVSDLFEVKNEQGSTYYVTLEDADGKVLLESVRGRKWVTYKETVNL